MTHLVTPPTAHDFGDLGARDVPGQTADVESMKRAHVNRLVVKRGALPPDFTPMNEYQKHVKFEITHGGLTDWNPEVIALGRVIDREPFVRMYFEQMLQEVPDGYRHFETVDLKRYMHVRCGNLSGGFQRLAAIACALSAGPQGLLVDEPLSGIDAQNGAALLATLAAARRRLDFLVVTSHSASDFAGANRFVDLTAGGAS